MSDQTPPPCPSPSPLPTNIPKVLDLRLPLPYLLSGVIFGGWVLISMWFTMTQLVTSTTNLQTEVRSGNASVVNLNTEVMLGKVRQIRMEEDIKALQVEAHARTLR